MEEEFQLITTLFKWRTGHSWKLLTVLTSCTIYTSLSVNISAHNCAGYSDPFPLEIRYDEGRVTHCFNDYLTIMSQIPIQWRTVVHRVRHQGLSLRVPLMVPQLIL